MLFYSKISPGNFGDDLNPWLWSRLAPEIFSDQSHRLFLGIGTLLGHRVPIAPVKVVFGSGFGYARPPQIDAKWFFYCVRGPITAAELGLPKSLALTDPAILVRGEVSPGPEASYAVSFMPHHQSMRYANWERLCRLAGIHCIDPRKGVDAVLADLLRTKLLLAEAMHGAIVADALRVPWIPVRLYGQFSELKWRDWADSLRVPLRVHSVPPVYERKLHSRKGVEQAAKKIAAQLGVGKTKWLNYTIRASSARDVEHTLKALCGIAQSTESQLSDEPRLCRLENMLRERLVLVRDHWKQDCFKPPCPSSA